MIACIQQMRRRRVGSPFEPARSVLAIVAMAVECAGNRVGNAALMPTLRDARKSVVPAQAGTQSAVGFDRTKDWIPASAGMTAIKVFRRVGSPFEPTRYGNISHH